jgi:hypothetical protein
VQRRQFLLFRNLWCTFQWFPKLWTGQPFHDSDGHSPKTSWSWHASGHCLRTSLGWIGAPHKESSGQRTRNFVVAVDARVTHTHLRSIKQQRPHTIKVSSLYDKKVKGASSSFQNSDKLRHLLLIPCALRPLSSKIVPRSVFLLVPPSV